eukprot:TRINITY_DN1254_c0_g1_i1.p1 TRINITY_DN1254_c0_g1~~TRINITY_DN1254_c0_g1_i1.p1  ORF type:complete len:448 (-),score=58.77 TRINITY_DN1254_c0_g1_i1:67-1410(-)
MFATTEAFPPQSFAHSTLAHHLESWEHAVCKMMHPQDPRFIHGTLPLLPPIHIASPSASPYASPYATPHCLSRRNSVVSYVNNSSSSSLSFPTSTTAPTTPTPSPLYNVQRRHSIADLLLDELHERRYLEENKDTYYSGSDYATNTGSEAESIEDDVELAHIWREFTRRPSTVECNIAYRLPSHCDSEEDGPVTATSFEPLFCNPSEVMVPSPVRFRVPSPRDDPDLHRALVASLAGDSDSDSEMPIKPEDVYEEDEELCRALRESIALQQQHFSSTTSPSRDERRCPSATGPTLLLAHPILNQELIMANSDNAFLAALERDFHIEHMDQKAQAAQEADRAVVAPVSSASSEPCVVAIVVRMPDGSRSERRFFAHSTMRDVKDWIDSLFVLDATSRSRPYNIVTTKAPHLVLSDQLSSTLDNLNLGPRATVKVALTHAAPMDMPAVN